MRLPGLTPHIFSLLKFSGPILTHNETMGCKGQVSQASRQGGEQQACHISHQLDPGNSPRHFPGFPHQLWPLGLAVPQALSPLVNFLPPVAGAQRLDQSWQHLEKKGKKWFISAHAMLTLMKILLPVPDAAGCRTCSVPSPQASASQSPIFLLPTHLLGCPSWL